MDFEKALCHQPSLRVPRAGTRLTVHRPLQVLENDFVEKVPRRVILYAPGAILHQGWAGHRYNISTVKLELLAIHQIIFTFEISTLHNFLWRTSLDRREVLEKLFSTSFGGSKVVMEAQFFMAALEFSTFFERVGSPFQVWSHCSAVPDCEETI